MRDKIQAMLPASFVADDLALGAHWIYDPRKIRDDFDDIRDYQQPPASSYHHPKNKGDFTHYGDQILLLLRCLAEGKSFSLDDYAVQWQRFMTDYAGYKDMASLQTMANFAAGAGPESLDSSSSDLAGASRIGTP